MIQGVGRDAEHVVKLITSRAKVQQQSMAAHAAYAATS
jgi:hypothetical protein